MSRFFKRKDKGTTGPDLASAAANTDIQPAPSSRPVTSSQDAATTTTSLSEKERAMQQHDNAAENDNFDLDADGSPRENRLAPTKSTATEDIVYPSGLKLFFLMSAIFVSMFLVSLDRLIISTAIPQITDDFHSVTDIGWYGSAYLLSNSAFQLMYGKIYTFFSIKIVFLTAIALFEVGSAICGAAPNSVAFIIGRAVAGLGSAGVMGGAIVILIYSVPLHKRPMYQGLFGAIFGLSSVVGPLLGGAFTSRVTWRWCFYINLPFGGVAIVLLFFLLDIPEREETNRSLGSKLAQLDAIGTAVFLPGIICLLLALQWGGSKYAWSEGRIVALLVLAGVLLVAFVLVQIYKPDTATVAPRIFKQRSIMAGMWATLCIGAQMMIFVYFLPIWMQAIKGVNAVDSGIRLLPMLLPMVFASIANGILVSKIGYYTPSMIVGNCILSVGCGLLTTLQVNSGSNEWIGYQVIYGLGMGCTFQAPSLAAQTVLDRKDVPVGTSLMFFSQLLGGAIFTSVGQNVLNSELLKRLAHIPGFDPALLQSNGATTLIASLPPNLREPVLYGYNESLRKVFVVGLIMACLTIFGSLSLEWRSTKKNMPKKGGDAGAKAEEGKARDADDKTDVEDEKTVSDRGGETTTTVGDEETGVPAHSEADRATKE